MNYALTALLVFCLIAWGFVLVPPAVRLLSGVIRPSDSIGSFRNKMAVLAGSTPSGYLRGPSPAPVPRRIAIETTSPVVREHQVLDLAAHRRAHPNRVEIARRRAAKQRRRNIFTGLLASVPATFVLAVIVGGPLWLVFSLSMAAFGGYTALLWQMQQTALERSRKVAFLPATAPPVAQQGELRRISVLGR
jgi:hypothetical protein